MLEVMYPALRVDHIQNPSRLYAIPLLGILIKVIICIPIFIELFFLNMASTVLTLMNAFYVLATGKYWDLAYEINLGVLRLTTKQTLFFFGLTNTYPGFDLTIDDPLIALDMVKPKNPGRFFAVPMIGGLVRLILLIPFLIYVNAINSAAGIASSFLASFHVLFKGKYPEFAYELARDLMRLNLASSVYLSGFSDSYPSFWISMNHKTIKIVLIILGVLLSLGNFGSSYTPKNSIQPSPSNQYTPGLQTQ